MLSNLHTANEALLQIMLVGQPELLKKLHRPELLQLSQRIGVNFHLEGLPREEVGDYIAYRLQKAGGRPDLFTEKAKEMIYELSGGIPRSINLLCQAALVYGFADEARMISKDTIDLIIEDKVGFSVGVQSRDQTPAGEPELESEATESVLPRLETLEHDLQDLKLEVQTQTQKLEDRAEGFKSELVKRLKQLLGQERKRNKNLVHQYAQIKMKYETLNRIHVKLEEELDSTPEEINPK